jgi:prefoldin subunit 5|tara:strand:+ start:5034 stop:5240 length:207 start_codon:yes stop_codon:yes gene_type:complete
MNNEIDVNVLVATLQKKITDLTLTNVVLEAKVKDLSNRLNSIIEKENAINGKQNQNQEFDNSEFSTTD